VYARDGYAKHVYRGKINSTLERVSPSFVMD